MDLVDEVDECRLRCTERFPAATLSAMDDISHRRGLWRTILLQGIVLLVLLVFVFPGTFLRGEMISPADMLFRIPPWKSYAPEGWTDTRHKLMSDVLTAFQPYYFLTKQALQNGEWPLWNPLEFTGMPLFANCQTAAFYPPRLLHAVLDIPLATTLYIILKLWLCGMTAFLCGVGIRLSVPASRFLSVGWMLASYNVIWCNWSLPDVSVWLPVMFLGVEWILEGRYRRGGVVLALGATLILLAGHPETAFAMSSALGVYFLVRLVWERRWGKALWAPVGACAGAWCVALLVCAGQLLPFAEYLANSATFFERARDTRSTCLPPGNVVSFWLPRFFGTTNDGNYWGAINSNLFSMIYPGMAVWLCLLLAPRRPRQAVSAGTWSLFSLVGRAPRTVCLTFTAVVFVLLAFQSPPLDTVHSLPVVGSMNQCYHIVFATFALPLLAALGLDRWISIRRRWRDLAWTLPVLFLMTAVIWGLYAFSAPLIHKLGMNSYINRQIVMAAVLAFLGLAVLAMQCYRSKPGLVAGLLIVLLAADLIYGNRGLNPTLPRAQILPDMQLIRLLQGLGTSYRYGLGEGDIPSGLMAPYGIEEWLAYDGLYPARIMLLHQKLKEVLWQHMEPVRANQYYLNDPQFPPFLPPELMKKLEYVATCDGLEVYRNPNACARAFLVGALEVIPSVEALFEAMKRRDFDPKRVAVTEVQPSGTLPHASTDDLGAASVDEHLSTCVRVTADAKEDCVLVLADAYFPGWKATIDGQPAELFPVYYNFRGLLLPAGRHRVEYVYAPWTFRMGMAISVITLMASILASLLCLRRRKRESMNAPTIELPTGVD